MANTPPRSHVFEIAHDDTGHTLIKTEDEPMPSAEDSHVKAHPTDVYIKPEPKDDDDLDDLFDLGFASPSVPTAAPASAPARLARHLPGLSMSVRPAPHLYNTDKYKMAAPNASRAKPMQADGTPAPTMCHENIYALHPHHHRLLCGHDIITPKLESCGVNCMLGTQNSGKPTGRAFVCAHPGCKHHIKKADQAFISVKVKGYRYGMLSHMYGIDLHQDKLRLEEKAAMAALGHPDKVVFKAPVRGRGMQEVQIRKRSVSPDLQSVAASNHRFLRSSSRKPRTRRILPDVVQQEKQAIDKYGLDQVMSLKAMHPGGAVPRNADGQIITEEEAQNQRVLARVAKSLRIDGTEKLAFSTQANTTKEVNMDFAQPDREVGAEHAREWTHTQLQGHYNGVKSLRNQHAADFSLPANTLEDMLRQESGVTLDREDNTADRLPRAQDDIDYDDGNLAKHCACQSVEDDFMLACGTCGDLFHPICVGENLQDSDDYDGHQRDEAMRKDALEYRKPGKLFLCVECQLYTDKEHLVEPKVFDEQPPLVQPMQQPGLQLKTRRQLEAAQHNLEKAQTMGGAMDQDDEEDMNPENNAIRTRHRIIEEKALGIHETQATRTKMRKPELKMLQEQAWATASAKAGHEIALKQAAAGDKRKRETSPEVEPSMGPHSRPATPQKKKKVQRSTPARRATSRRSVSRKPRGESVAPRRSTRRSYAPTSFQGDLMEE